MNNNKEFLDNKFKQVAKLIAPNSKILDIGCNDGNLRNFLANAMYYAVDLDKEMIKNLVKAGIKAKSADLNKNPLPFKKEQFDYILLLDVLEHVVNPQKLLSDSKERLKENGKMVITLPNDYHILNKIRFIFNKPLTEDPFAPYGHLHYFSIKDGERFLIKNGFKILEKYPIAPVKPSFIPQSIKNFLGKFFQQSFARDILYLISINKNK